MCRECHPKKARGKKKKKRNIKTWIGEIPLWLIGNKAEEHPRGCRFDPGVGGWGAGAGGAEVCACGVINRLPLASGG